MTNSIIALVAFFYSLINPFCFCINDTVQKNKDSLRIEGFYLPCNNNDLLFFINILGKEYDIKNINRNNDNLEYPDFFYLINSDGFISAGPNKMPSLGQFYFINSPLDPIPWKVVAFSKKIPAWLRSKEIQLRVDPEDKKTVCMVRIPNHFSLVSEIPLRFQYNEGSISKDFTVKDNDKKFWFRDKNVYSDGNIYYYSSKLEILYIMEHGDISTLEEATDYLTSYHQEKNSLSLTVRKSSPRKQRKEIENKLKQKFHFHYVFYNAFLHNDIYETDIPAPINHFCITHKREVLAFAINGKLYIDGKEVYSLLDDPIVWNSIRFKEFYPTNFMFETVYFGEDFVLFFLTYNMPGTGLIIKYDRNSNSSSILYFSENDSELQREMNRVALKQTIDNFAEMFPTFLLRLRMLLPKVH